MCGIVGYVGKRPVQDLLLAGLTRLEYRGYDSAGISMIRGDAIDSVRAVGNLDHLREAVAGRVAPADEGSVAVATRPATTGIGHTRWATHGRVNEDNAHPHFDTTGSRPRRRQRDRRELHGAQGAPDRHGRRVHVRDRRRGHRPPRQPPPRRRRPSSTPSAPPTPSSRATTRSWPCRSTSPTCSSARARSAR